jgi:hypothetical protein
MAGYSLSDIAWFEARVVTLPPATGTLSTAPLIWLAYVLVVKKSVVPLVASALG